MKKYFIVYLLITLVGCKNNSKNSLKENLTKNNEKEVLINSDTTLLADRLVPLQGAINFRELGGIKTTDGKKVKKNLLYRSDKLSLLTDTDLKKIENLKIKTVIDFRTDGETLKEPDNLPENLHINYLNFPIGDNSWANGDFMKKIAKINPKAMDSIMANLYKDMIIKYSDEYKKFFNEVKDPKSTPLVFHCTAGKDRTGVASALLLYILGVDKKTIEKEYELTNYYRKNNNKEYETMMISNGISEDVAKILMGVKAKYIKAVFEEINKEYGSLDNYFTNELSVDATDKKKLRDFYLE